VVLDAVDFVGPSVVAHELRRVGVDDVGVARDPRPEVLDVMCVVLVLSV
jgi:hypothetical protein